MLTVSTHWDAGQSYVTTVMLRVGADRIEPVASLFTFSDRLCAMDLTQTPSFATRAGDDPDHPDIAVTVTEVMTPTDDDCEQEPVAASTRIITATYRWDAAARTYGPDSDALQRLEEENFERP